MDIKKFNEYKINESSEPDKIKISLDVHGVIDALPKTFSFISKALVAAGAEVHIVTGGKINDELIEMLNNFGIQYTHIFSIVDYHHEKGTPTTGNHPKYGFPMISDEVWDKTKGDYCREHNISLHLDDTLIYNDNFTTPFGRIWTHNGRLKPTQKDPRHLD